MDFVLPKVREIRPTHLLWHSQFRSPFLIFSCLGGFCDVKHLFGDITGEENLDMTGTDGIFRNANGLCDAGVCYVVGVANSCEAICGKNPCPKLQDEEPCKGEFCGP